MYVTLQNLSKSYDGKKVLDNFSHTFSSGHAYGIMAPSGTGKTTLFRLILGLEHPDAGTILCSDTPCPMSAVFQENRLLMDVDAVENIMLTAPKGLTRRAVSAEAARILPADSLTLPVCEFSGGMKRRTAILRALLASFELLVMDEPFTGLDDVMRLEVIRYIKEKTRNKILIFSTHQSDDIVSLDAERIFL